MSFAVNATRTAASPVAATQNARDKSFKIWDLEDYRCLESVKAHEDAINVVAVSINDTVYTTSMDGCIKVWERDDKVKRHTLVSTIGKMKSSVNALAFDDDGTTLFSGGCNIMICRWERKYGGEDGVVSVETLRDHNGAILCLIIMGDLLSSELSDQKVKIWQLENESNGYCCRVVLEGHDKPIKSLVVFSGGEEGHSNRRMPGDA